MPRCPLQARLCLPMPGIPLPSLPTAKQQQHRPSPQLVLSSKNQRDEDELTAQSHRRLLRCVPSKRRHSARVNGRRRMLERPALRCAALELHDDTSARRGAAEKTRDETTTERGTSVFFSTSCPARLTRVLVGGRPGADGRTRSPSERGVKRGRCRRRGGHVCRRWW